jgi:hypothetical protein
MSMLKRILFLFLAFLTLFSYTLFAETEPMFTQTLKSIPTKIKNLKNINFEERSKVEALVDELIKAGTDPYTASLPLIAAAELGDAKRYEVSKNQMLKALEMLDEQPTNYSEWMRNNSFKSWMWGRVLLAADSMNDGTTISIAKNKLAVLLEEKITPQDSLAFFTWGWGYRAALDQKEYDASYKKMFDGAMQLTARYRGGKGDHDALSNALWAWVMNLPAAANADDTHKYTWIKQQILFLTGETSVTNAIEKGLLRTAASNDYPAWALAKIRCAAVTMNDKELYQEIDTELNSSISASKDAGAKAEYVLAVLESELALINGKDLQSNSSILLHRK